MNVYKTNLPISREEDKEKQGRNLLIVLLYWTDLQWQEVV